MARVDITLNGRTYTVGCEDGQEARLRELARYLDSKLREVARASGASPTEPQLLAMAALVVTDQLFDLKAEYDRLEAEAQAARLQPGASLAPAVPAETEAAVVAAVDHLARRIEDIAARLERA
jgi:cell division protein ZapA